jgi:hypothetical protein
VQVFEALQAADMGDAELQAEVLRIHLRRWDDAYSITQGASGLFVAVVFGTAAGTAQT